MSSNVTSRHASGTHVICLANQNNSGELHLQTCQDAANQNQLRHSTYNIVRSHWGRTLLCRLACFYFCVKHARWESVQSVLPVKWRQRRWAFIAALMLTGTSPVDLLCPVERLMMCKCNWSVYEKRWIRQDGISAQQSTEDLHFVHICLRRRQMICSAWPRDGRARHHSTLPHKYIQIQISPEQQHPAATDALVFV